MSLKDDLKKIELANPPTSEPEVKDSWDRARSIWRKGRHEAMGGFTWFTQDGRDNNNRTMGYPPAGRARDPYIDELGMDVQE